MLRTLSLLLAVAVLVGCVLWLTAPPSVRSADEGAALRVIGCSGARGLLVERAPGRWEWRREPVGATQPTWLALPDTPLGLPRLDSAGRVHWLGDTGVALFRGEGDPEWCPPPLEARGTLQLVGVDHDNQPVLREEHAEGDRLFVRTEALGWILLSEPAGRAAVPADSHVLLHEHRAALAFRGAEGWEAWLHDAVPARRLVARRRRGDDAVFTPDGRALIVEGIVDGLDRLELDESHMRFMADGNFGDSSRVPFSAGIRGDPPLLASVMHDTQGFLQVIQTHLGGGGRHQFTTGQLQHYLPRVSPSGRWLSYAQADFELQGDDAFREDLYLFDFDGQGRPARLLGSRSGGHPHQGPLFLGDGGRLAWIADGRLLVAWLAAVPSSP
ncbi:MAG: hypothetical protein DHS20C15_14880 [Planctomycetota bacterium]|nr:MAG: hypothetical protein DHS20C15_14880 [Planctomycetota bacterium]